MPFCRECGKEVEEDWTTCPSCSQPIGPPSKLSFSLQEDDSTNKNQQNLANSVEKEEFMLKDWLLMVYFLTVETQCMLEIF